MLCLRHMNYLWFPPGSWLYRVLTSVVGDLLRCKFFQKVLSLPTRTHINRPWTRAQKVIHLSASLVTHYGTNTNQRFFGTNLYLLREVMCSSDRPPSSSLTMNSLSFSSPGCTGKLLRKMSRRTIDYKKVNTLNSTWKLPSWQIAFSSCDEMPQKAFWRQRALCLITFPQMPEGNAQICILASQSWCDFLVLQKMSLHNSGAVRSIH